MQSEQNKPIRGHIYSRKKRKHAAKHEDTLKYLCYEHFLVCTLLESQLWKLYGCIIRWLCNVVGHVYFAYFEPCIYMIYEYDIYVYLIIYVPCRLSPKWLYGNSCTWAHDVRLTEIRLTIAITERAHCFHDYNHRSCAQVHEFP